MESRRSWAKQAAAHIHRNTLQSTPHNVSDRVHQECVEHASNTLHRRTLVDSGWMIDEKDESIINSELTQVRQAKRARARTIKFFSRKRDGHNIQVLAKDVRAKGCKWFNILLNSA